MVMMIERYFENSPGSGDFTKLQTWFCDRHGWASEAEFIKVRKQSASFKGIEQGKYRFESMPVDGHRQYQLISFAAAATTPAEVA